MGVSSIWTVARGGGLVLAAGTLLAASACGGDNNSAATGPTGPPALTAEQQAIAEALAGVGILSGVGGGFNVLALAQATERQQLNGFDAFGIQVVWTLSGGQPDDEGWFTGIVGWTGLNSAAGTADEAFTIGLEAEGTSVVTTGTGQVGQRTGGFGTIALYVERANDAFYVGRSGTLTVDNDSFGNPAPCATEDGIGIVIDCTVAVGTMAGSYDFSADLSSGSGPPNYSQAQTAFDLPAIRVELTEQ